MAAGLSGGGRYRRRPAGAAAAALRVLVVTDLLAQRVPLGGLASKSETDTEHIVARSEAHDTGPTRRSRLQADVVYGVGDARSNRRWRRNEGRLRARPIPRLAHRAGPAAARSPRRPPLRSRPGRRRPGRAGRRPAYVGSRASVPSAARCRGSLAFLRFRCLRSPSTRSRRTVGRSPRTVWRVVDVTYRRSSCSLRDVQAENARPQATAGDGGTITVLYRLQPMLLRILVLGSVRLETWREAHRPRRGIT